MPTPLIHFLTGIVLSLVVVSFLKVSRKEKVWLVLIGGLVSVLIDVDHIAMALSSYPESIQVLMNDPLDFYNRMYVWLDPGFWHTGTIFGVSLITGLGWKNQGRFVVIGCLILHWVLDFIMHGAIPYI